ncbi:hypothetical protein [Piscibacillus salipiscarius]|uniref:hypothetical protein n=1 Tax=Piscibacillus salipiscarius TaxID=299480 RepID=UPI0034E29139
MSDDKHRDIIDQDLVEDIDEEEMYEIIQENKQKSVIRNKRKNKSQNAHFPNGYFGLLLFLCSLISLHIYRISSR